MAKIIKGDTLRIYSDYSNQSLSQSFNSPLYERDGKTILHGFKIDVENTSVTLRLEIDGQVLFTESLDDLDNFFYADFDAGGSNKFFNRPNYGVMEFFPPSPLQATDNLKIYIRKDVSWDLELEKYNIFVEEL